jgi:NADH dehydrogenase FAD-containing subunit
VATVSNPLLLRATAHVHLRLSDADRKALLTWVIVGGGPTGSELAAELHDLVNCKQFKQAYPLIAPNIHIKLIDAAPTILSTFDKRLAEYAAAKFRRAVSFHELPTFRYL